MHLSLIAQVSLDLSNVQTNVRKQFTHSAEMQIVSKHSSPEGCWCCSHFHPSMRIAIRDFWTQKVSELNMEIYLAKFNFFRIFMDFLSKAETSTAKTEKLKTQQSKNLTFMAQYFFDSVSQRLSNS